MKYEGKVAIVTGAGGGLGRVYALALGARGAKVVVNDLGGSTRGEGKDAGPADRVVAEIVKAGGQAVANYDSVTDGEKIVQTALKAYGRVDILINNAGILRDVTFHKMTEQDWNLLYQVHLQGTYSVTRAAWDHMRKNNYGRIIMVTSAAGLYGNFGQAHYSAVKMGIVGLANTLAREGAKNNITVNTIAPVAGSRMTETVMPPDLVQALKAEYVSPLVLALAHESNTEQGGIFEVGAGWISKVRWQRSEGATFPLNDSFNVESVRDSWSKVNDFSKATYPTAPNESFGVIMENLSRTKSDAAPAAPVAAEKKSEKKADKKGKAKSNADVDVQKVLSHKFEPFPFTYTERDVILYALGIGAAANPWDPKELQFTYEGASDFSVIPTFGVVVPFSAMGGIVNLPGLTFNPMMLLHGEQYMELKKPLATSGTLTNYPRISALHDKGKGALLVLDVITKNEKGEEVMFNQYSSFIRGIGGFSDGSDKATSKDKTPSHDPPKRPPDVVHREKTSDNQALLYRLSGDLNPLHADPSMAAMGGFDKPILHGLCSFGYAARAVLRHFCDNDVSKFKSIRVRFVKHVFPGETIVTEMWRDAPNRIIFRCKVAERGDVVLSNAAIELDVPAGAAPAASAAAVATPSAAPTAGGNFKAAAVFHELKGRVNPDLVKKIGSVYRFDLTNGKENQSWLADLKNGSGSVSAVDTKNPPAADCIMSMHDDDFVGLMTGKLNAQKAFMSGKIKIKGNMMLAQKLSLLSAEAPAKPVAAATPAAPAATPAAAGGDFKAAAVFNQLKGRVNADLVKQVGSVYRFDVTNANKQSQTWLVDLKNGSGSVATSNDKAAADCIVAIQDDDFVQLMSGKLNPQKAFMSGKLKVKGNMMLAQKLSLLVNQRSSL